MNGIQKRIIQSQLAAVRGLIEEIETLVENGKMTQAYDALVEVNHSIDSAAIRCARIANNGEST